MLFSFVLTQWKAETAGEDKMAGQIVARVRPPPPLSQDSRRHHWSTNRSTTLPKVFTPTILVNILLTNKVPTILLEI